MTSKFHGAAAASACALVLAAAGPASAATGLVNFETNPTLGTAPSIYIAVPAEQVLTTPEATFSGGVVLGFATFFPAIAFATAPNVYGTADFANGLPEQLTITTNPGFATTEVSFALFNGETFAQSYTATAFNGNTVVATQNLSNIAPNWQSGYSLVDLIAAGGITKVTITPDGTPTAYDFLIDTVAFNQSITSVIPSLPPPPPSVDPSQPIVIQTPPVHGHRHGRKKGEGETELLEVNFGDDINDIRGSVLVVTQVPEPSTWAMMVLGACWVGFTAVRRRKPALACAA